MQLARSQLKIICTVLPIDETAFIISPLDYSRSFRLSLLFNTWRVIQIDRMSPMTSLYERNLRSGTWTTLSNQTSWASFRGPLSPNNRRPRISEIRYLRSRAPSVSRFHAIRPHDGFSEDLQVQRYRTKDIVCLNNNREGSFPLRRNMTSDRWSDVWRSPRLLLLRKLPSRITIQPIMSLKTRTLRDL